MNARDKKKMNRATELAAEAIQTVVDAYVDVLGSLVNNEMRKMMKLPHSLQSAPIGYELEDSIDFLDNRINCAEKILFSKVMELSGKDWDIIEF